MKTKIVRIGNSRGIRIPKGLLEEAQLDGEVELRVSEEGLSIERVGRVREGWASAASELALASSAGDDPFVSTEFDDEEWEW